MILKTKSYSKSLNLKFGKATIFAFLIFSVLTGCGGKEKVDPEELKTACDYLNAFDVLSTKILESKKMIDEIDEKKEALSDEEIEKIKPLIEALDNLIAVQESLKSSTKYTVSDMATCPNATDINLRFNLVDRGAARKLLKIKKMLQRGYKSYKEYMNAEESRAIEIQDSMESRAKEIQDSIAKEISGN